MLVVEQHGFHLSDLVLERYRINLCLVSKIIIHKLSQFFWVCKYKLHLVGITNPSDLFYLLVAQGQKTGEIEICRFIVHIIMYYVCYLLIEGIFCRRSSFSFFWGTPIPLYGSISSISKAMSRVNLKKERWQSLAECAALEMRFTLRVTGVQIPLSPQQLTSRKAPV